MLDAGGVRGHQDHRLLPMRGRGRVGLAHHDQQPAARVLRTARPPLGAVDDVLVAVADDRGRDVGRVRARHGGLGHAERRPDRAVEQRPQPLLLLRLGADQVEQLHVAGVGRLAVHRLGRELVAPAAELGERRVLQLGQPGLRGQEEVPQTALAGLELELLDHRRDEVVVGAGLFAVSVVRRLGREDLVLHELHQGGVELDGLRGGRGVGGVHPASEPHQMSVIRMPACAL